MEEQRRAQKPEGAELDASRLHFFCAPVERKVETVVKIYNTAKETKKKSRRPNWWIFGAIFGLVGGFIFPLFGGLILAAVERGAEISLRLENFAFMLALSTIPLLVVGAYCLDVAVDKSLPKRVYHLSRRRLQPRRRAAKKDS